MAAAKAKAPSVAEILDGAIDRNSGVHGAVCFGVLLSLMCSFQGLRRRFGLLVRVMVGIGLFRSFLVFRLFLRRFVLSAIFFWLLGMNEQM